MALCIELDPTQVVPALRLLAATPCDCDDGCNCVRKRASKLVCTLDQLMLDTLGKDTELREAAKRFR